jgi:hypothetical protein
MIEETKRYLLSSHREQLNALSGSINDTVTTVTFNFPMGSIAGGSVIAVDLEVMYVWSSDPAGKTAVVQRGLQGSKAASHSDGALVTINPKFPDFSIFQALNADLSDISGDLFQIKVSTFTYIAGKEGYDLGVPVGIDPIATLNGRYDYPGIRRNWPVLRGFYIRRDANLTDFPSGYAVVMTEQAFPGRQIRITYAAQLGSLVSANDDVLAVTGLDPGSHDIPPIGAAIRLQGVREGQRNFNDSQPDTRRAAEVPAGAQIQSIHALVDFHRGRVQSSQKMLLKQYPYHQRIENSEHSWTMR